MAQISTGSSTAGKANVDAGYNLNVTLPTDDAYAGKARIMSENDPGTITGSIGVFGILPTAEGLMDKLSLHTGGVTTTWLAGGYDPRRPLDPRLKAAVQAGIDNIAFSGLNHEE